MNREWVVFDLDGCLTECIPGKRLDWSDVPGTTAWLQALKPNLMMVALFQVLYNAGLPVMIMTGRPETYRQVTEDWLQQHRILPFRLWMRPADDIRSDAEAKRAMLTQIRETGNGVWFVVEDRVSVVAMWRSEGITCLQCAEGNY